MISPAERGKPLPLSLSQHRLWFIDRLDKSASLAYHMPAAMRLIGVLDKPALQSTLDQLIARHESLRTYFVTIDSTPYQAFLPADIGFDLQYEDFSTLANKEREIALAEKMSAETRACFSLNTGPLIRGQLLKLHNKEHVLLLTQHHIVSDGWSFNILVREVVTLYSAFYEGKSDPLPPLEIQYADYAQWQRSWLRGAELNRQFVFWKEHLNGAPTLLNLPLDKSRPDIQSHTGGDYSTILSPELTVKLKAFSQHQGTTLYMTLLSAWGVLLSRLSGQNDVVIGTPVANRQRKEVEGLIGFFVNTLALRVRFDDRPNVSEILTQIKETTLAAFAHQELPFEQVVEAIQPNRSLSHSPLFQTMLSFNNTGGGGNGGDITLPDLTLAPIKSHGNVVHFDLSLSLSDEGDFIGVTFEYASDLFDASTIECWSTHYQCLLESMVCDVSQKVDSLSILTDGIRDQILYGFNTTATDYPHEMTLASLFEQQVALQPEAVALGDSDSCVSYAQLNTCANRLAHYLIGQGVGPDDRIALVGERSIAFVVSVLGIVKAGGAYLPLDPSHPQERLQYILEDASPTVLLLQEGQQGQLPEVSTPKLVIDSEEGLAALAGQPTSNPEVESLSSSHLAYVVYTSGSTGEPKGVMVEQSSVSGLVCQQHYYQASSGDVLAFCANPAFDAATWELWGALLNGARLQVMSGDLLLDGARLRAELEAHHVNVLHLTVGLFNQHAEALSGYYPALDYLLFGGEKADASKVRQVLSQGKPRHLVQCYGPTETTTFASTELIKSLDSSAVVVPIGKPIGNTQVYILDSQGEPVPIGVEGEIHIAGAGVARGYLNRPELTAERFISNPFSEVSKARMYKTGDLGRWLSDGTIEYVGRNDFQVKIRGFRIELGEIEAKLSDCEGIREAVVLAREDVEGDKRLVAYLLSEEGMDLSVSGLRESLQARLPDYMIPSAFVPLDVFPLTANGKLDRQALPVPDGEMLSSREYEAPQGEIEEAVASLWQELLNVPKVGRHDNFFELGGHSLLVVKMVERLEDQNITGDVRTVFSSPVLSQFTTRLNKVSAAVSLAIPANLITSTTAVITPDLLPLADLEQGEIGRIVASVPGGIANIQDIYPLLPLQEGMLFHHLLEKEGDIYLLRDVLAFDNRERLDGFLSILQKLIDRHDILRTAVRWEELSSPVQIVHRKATLPVQYIDIPAGRDAIEAIQELTDPQKTRLDMRQAPLLTAYITENGEQGEWLLSLLSHHMVCDHSTMELLIVEIQTLLHNPERQLLPSAPFRNLVAQSKQISPNEHKSYFRSQLADIEVPTAPFNIFNVRVKSSELTTVGVKIDDNTAQLLRSSAAQLGLPVSVLFHVAWGQVLSRCTGCVDVVFGTVLSGRLQGAAGTNRALGMLINTLPLRLSLEGEIKLAVQQCYQSMIELLAHEQAPLSLAQRCSGVTAHLPLFTTLFNYRQSTPSNAASENETPEMQGIRLLTVQEMANYPISISVDDYGQDFSLKLQCVRSVDASRIRAYMLTALETLVHALNEPQSQSLLGLNILPKEELSEVLYGFNTTATDYPHEMTLASLFEQQVALQPEAVALGDSDSCVSYAQLNTYANRLAHYLIGQGVGPDDRIALVGERSIAFVVSVLGIVKAGGAYLPLDPSHPQERLQYILEDASPTVLLLQEGQQGQLPEVSTPKLVIDSEEGLAALAGQPTSNPEVESLSSSHLAYVVYTSGSTGEPKGVMVEQSSVSGLVCQQHYYQASSGDVLAFCANPAFDAATWELWGALLNGARLQVMSGDLLLDGARLRAELEAHHVNVLHLTVGLFNQHAEALSGYYPALDYLLFGGEKADASKVRQVLSQGKPRHLVQCYGPTETTTFASTELIKSLDSSAVVVPIGKPIGNTQVYILDSQGEPVPIGVEGEIHIAGAGVARGYLNRPELTAERFISNPFSEVSKSTDV